MKSKTTISEEYDSCRTIGLNQFVIKRWCRRQNGGQGGGAITVLDQGLYNMLNVNMLKDTYRPLSSNPTSSFLHSLWQLLDEGTTSGALSPTEADKLFVPHPVVPILHSLPKVHKDTFPPQLRPIVAGIGSMGERLSAWVDAHLQPLIEIIPSYIKDTKELVCTLDC